MTRLVASNARLPETNARGRRAIRSIGTMLRARRRLQLCRRTCTRPAKAGVLAVVHRRAVSEREHARRRGRSVDPGKRLFAFPRRSQCGLPRDASFAVRAESHGVAGSARIEQAARSYPIAGSALGMRSSRCLEIDHARGRAIARAR